MGPLTQFGSAKSAEHGRQRAGGFGVACVEAGGRFSVGQVESALAGQQKLTSYGRHGIKDMHTQGGPGL